MSESSSALTPTDRAHNPMHLSNNMLRRSFDDGVPVTPMKLQRLLYLTAVDYARRTGGGPLIYEPFQAWRYGPVLRSVYDKFQPVGHEPIRGYARDAAGGAQLIRESTSPEVAAALDAVWAEFRHLTPAELSQIICQPGTVWRRTYLAGEGTPLPDGELWSDLYFAHV